MSLLDDAKRIHHGRAAGAARLAAEQERRERDQESRATAIQGIGLDFSVEARRLGVPMVVLSSGRTPSVCTSRSI
ncbi:hypothetical protein GKE82_23900 [Conexibacter sp. W3-3-2]|uniref:hypothetical protein n=1 Tax=Conexibacter sp. W3-3-2 TaxID=2675227 RepID=UPI0012B7501B|nr:hypothetical protein [Conexibacter sp. W3-3-2]MTD47251.1 hypothetical protein [Conexibacter sp. W3-3-2]